MVELIQQRDYDVLVQTLTPNERVIIVELLGTSKSASEVVPDNIDAGELWEKLGATAKALARINSATSRLKPFLGRMLIILQKHPDLFTNVGYPNFNEFMGRGCAELFGVSRSEAFACKRIAEEFGDRMSPAEMEEIGMSKLSIAATAVRKRVDEGMPPEKREEQIRYWINAAKNDTFVALKERLVDEKLVEEGELEMKSHMLTLRADVRDQWMKFRREPYVIATCGANTDSSVISCLIAEVEMEWRGRYEAELRSTKENN